MKLFSYLADAILRKGTTNLKVLKNQSYKFEVKQNSTIYILFECFGHMTVTYVLTLDIVCTRVILPYSFEQSCLNINK